MESEQLVQRVDFLEIMGDEDIRKRSILKQTAAYLPAQMPETLPSYIHSQDFEFF